MKTFSGQKVMVVEDNFMSYKLIEAHFRRSNLTLVHAGEGPLAIDLYRNDPEIEVILMDIQLPGMNGLDVTRAIREFDKDVPIIAATANAFDDDKTACLIAGCTDYITKPINFSVLYELLDKYLN